MEDQSVTILNFECKNCQTKIGQFVVTGYENEDDIKCPTCGLKNYKYSTFLK